MGYRIVKSLIYAELGSLLDTSHDFRETDFTMNDLIGQECEIQLHETHLLHACICMQFSFRRFSFVFVFFCIWLRKLTYRCTKYNFATHTPACTCEILNASDSMYILNQVILVSEL